MTDIAATTIVQEGINSYREVSVLDRRTSTAIATGDSVQSSWPSAICNSSGFSRRTRWKCTGSGCAGFGRFSILTQDAVAAVATLVVFLAAASRVMPSLLRIQAGLATMHGSSGAAERAYELSESLAGIEDSARVPEAAARIRERAKCGNPDFDPRIEVSHAITYPGSCRTALFETSLSVPSGGSLALVGATERENLPSQTSFSACLIPMTGLY